MRKRNERSAHASPTLDGPTRGLVLGAGAWTGAGASAAGLTVDNLGAPSADALAWGWPAEGGIGALGLVAISGMLDERAGTAPAPASVPTCVATDRA